MKADKDKLRKVGQCVRAMSCATRGFCVQVGAVGQASRWVGPLLLPPRPAGKSGTGKGLAMAVCILALARLLSRSQAGAARLRDVSDIEHGWGIVSGPREGF